MFAPTRGLRSRFKQDTRIDGLRHEQSNLPLNCAFIPLSMRRKKMNSSAHAQLSSLVHLSWWLCDTLYERQMFFAAEPSVMHSVDVPARANILCRVPWLGLLSLHACANL